MESYKGPVDETYKSLYVGNLDPRVTDVLLHQIFSTAGEVVNVKIIPDKNHSHGGLNYGFIDFNTHKAAENAMLTLNGRKLFSTEIRVNWAFAGNSANKEETSHHHHIFVGDLSPEITDQLLGKAFSAFPSLSDARVMWDMASGKSRGYGFVSFRDRTDAEQAIATMNGEWLGSRAIRVNWANQKSNTGIVAPTTNMPRPPMGPPGSMTYEQVLAQTPAYNTTVYIGNLPPSTTQMDLVPYFQQYGYIVEMRMQADKGYAFCKMDTHENAATAILTLQGTVVHGRPARLSWGKDRAPDGYNPQSYNMYMSPANYSYPYPQGYPYPNGSADSSATSAAPTTDTTSTSVAPSTTESGSTPATTTAAAPAGYDAYYAQYYAQYYGQQAPPNAGYGSSQY